MRPGRYLGAIGLSMLLAMPVVAQTSIAVQIASNRTERDG